MKQKSEIYKEWDEYVNPDYILVTLINGRKLQIGKKHIKGGKQMYQAILQAFGDNVFEITDRIVGAMVTKLNQQSEAH